MTAILFTGAIPEFAPLAALLRESGIDAVHRPGIAAGGFGLVSRAVVSDATQAEATLAARPAAPCIVVLDEPSPRAIERWLNAGAAACLVRPFPAAVLLRSLAESLAAA